MIPFSSPSATTHPSPIEQYTKRLSQVISVWSNLTTSQREQHIINLNNHLQSCPSYSIPNLCLLTLHSFSHLLSRDAVKHKPTPYWSVHPNYSEPLLIKLLDLFHLCFQLSPAQILKTAFLAAPPKPHHFSFAFIIAQLNSFIIDEPSVQIKKLSLLVLIHIINVIDSPLLASFLPGIFTCFTSILAGSVRLHSALAIPALNALSLLIKRTFPPLLSNNQHSNSSNHSLSVSDALRSLSIQSDPKNNTSSPPADTDAINITPRRPRTSLPFDLKNKPPSKNENISPFSSSSSSSNPPSSLRLSLDESWVSKTVEQLVPRLAQIICAKNGPRFHSQVSVRLALIEFLDFLLQRQFLPLDDYHISLFKFSLLQLCSHPYPSVSKQASQSLYKFFNSYRSTGVSHLEKTVVASLKFARFYNQSQNVKTVEDEEEEKEEVEEEKEKVCNSSSKGKNMIQLMEKNDLKALKKLAGTASEDDHFATAVCFGCLSILIPSSLSKSTGTVNYVFKGGNKEEEKAEQTFIIPIGYRLQAFMHRVGVAAFANMLCKLHEEQWNPGRVDRKVVQDALKNKITYIAENIGYIGLLPCMYDALFALAAGTNSNELGSENHIDKESQLTMVSINNDDFNYDMNSFKKRAHAIIILSYVVKGALVQHKRKLISSVTELDMNNNQSKYLKKCIKEILEMNSKLFIPNEKESTVKEMYEINDDHILTIKFALLDSLLVITKTVCQEIKALRRSDIILIFLMNLLRDIAHSHEVICKEAFYVFQHIATLMKCQDERDLILRHLNFIISRIIHFLKYKWAGRVLKFIISGFHHNISDAVSREATLLLQRTVKNISDNLAGVSDERASQMLMTLTNILSTAVIQKSIMESIRTKKRIIKNDSTTKSRENEKDEVRESQYIKSEDENARVEALKTLILYCTEEITEKDKQLIEMPSMFDSNNDDNKIMKNDIFDGFDSEDEEQNEIDNENDDVTEFENIFKLTRAAFEQIAENALDGSRDLMVGRPWNIRAAALECSTYAVRYFKRRKKILLPHVAKILPLLPDQFANLNEELSSGERMMNRIKKRKNLTLSNDNNNSKEVVEDLIYMINKKGSELPIILHACKLLTALSECAGSFIRERFIRLIYPKMKPLLSLCYHFPTLLSDQHNVIDNLPSYGAMAVCDACLESLSSVSIETPIALIPFTKQLIHYVSKFMDTKYDPESGSSRSIVHTNRSMVRFEKERWDKRVMWSENIIRGLIRVNEGEAYNALLCYDENGPKVWESGHEDLLDIMIRPI